MEVHALQFLCQEIPDILSRHYFSFSVNSKMRPNTTSRRKSSLGECPQNYYLVELSSYSTFFLKLWDDQVEFPFTFWKCNWLEQLFVCKLYFSKEEISKSSILISILVIIPLVARVEWAESHLSVLLINGHMKIFNNIRYFDSLTTYAAFKGLMSHPGSFHTENTYSHWLDTFSWPL